MRISAEEKKQQLLALVSHWALTEMLNPIPADEFERDRGIRFRGYKVTIARLFKADAADGSSMRSKYDHSPVNW